MQGACQFAAHGGTKNSGIGENCELLYYYYVHSSVVWWSFLLADWHVTNPIQTKKLSQDVHLQLGDLDMVSLRVCWEKRVEGVVCVCCGSEGGKVAWRCH